MRAVIPHSPRIGRIRPGRAADGPPPPRRRAAAAPAPRGARCGRSRAGAPPARRAASCWSASGCSAGSSSIRRSTSASTSSSALAARHPPVAARLDELADVGLPLGPRGRAVRERGGAGRALVHGQPPAPELVQQAEGAREQDRRDGRDHHHDDPDHGAEVHAASVASASVEMAPRWASRAPLRYDVDSPISRVGRHRPRPHRLVPHKETSTWLTSPSPTSRKTCASWRTTLPRRRSGPSRGSTTGTPRGRRRSSRRRTRSGS